MPVIAEQKVNCEKRPSARVLRVDAGLSRADKPSSNRPKNKASNKSAETLFENRLVLMSSLRKNLAP